MDNTKVPIELTPYNALAILSFLREFEYDEPHLKALGEAVQEFENSMCRGISVDQIEDAKAENQVNQLIGKSPVR